MELIQAIGILVHLAEKYAGKVGGDEKYFDSDDPGSGLSEGDKCSDDEVPDRRQSIRVEYDPKCEIPL